ncbi:hypothetical protein QTO30_18150 [Yoonia sp. GPGPB17]|uniref:hypothetical protein n=1 Tax=Yoonia sp. GPGPB17 TaxID=3026147 RepID=UPI0030BCBCEA
MARAICPTAVRPKAFHETVAVAKRKEDIEAVDQSVDQQDQQPGQADACEKRDDPRDLRLDLVDVENKLPSAMM